MRCNQELNLVNIAITIMKNQLKTSKLHYYKLRLFIATLLDGMQYRIIMTSLFVISNYPANLVLLKSNQNVHNCVTIVQHAENQRSH